MQPNPSPLPPDEIAAIAVSPLPPRRAVITVGSPLPPDPAPVTAADTRIQRARPPSVAT